MWLGMRGRVWDGWRGGNLFEMDLVHAFAGLEMRSKYRAVAYEVRCCYALSL